MLNKKFKKAISAVTMFSTVIALSGVSLLAPLAASADTSIVDGDVIKSNATNSDGTPTLGSLDVYIVKVVGNKTYKRLVLNPQVFASYGHLKWSNIKTVSQAVEDSYTTSNLVRVDGDSKVYALTPAGDTGAKSWVNVTATQFLTDAASDPDSIYTINSVDGGNYASRADITTVAQLKAFYKDGTLPASPVSGDLTASLSAATPEAMNIPVGASAEFAEVKLAAGSTAASINSLTVTASGYGDADNINDVALYIDGAKVGSSKDINSEKEATFNFTTPISISANSSKTLVIKATAAAAGTYKLGIKESADIVTAGGSVGGSFPIYGNGMVADANVTTGTVTMSAVETADTTNSFGDDNVLLGGFTLEANNEAAILDSIRLKNGGSNEDGIISNLRLVADGEDIATGSYDASTGYVTFNVDGAYKIDKGDSAQFEVYGDLGVASANDTIQLYIKNKDDVAFTGEDYGFGVQISDISALDAAGDGVIVSLETGDISIDMDKAATPAKDVKADTDNVVLGTFKVTSNGEDATLEQIVDATGKVFQIQGTGLLSGDIENVEMKDTATGSIYDIDSTYDTGVYKLSMNDEISLAKGETKTFEIRADLNSSLNVNDTLKVVVEGDAMKITGETSDADITDITPGSVTSAVTTIKDVSLDVTTTSMTAKSIVAGASDISVYQGSFEAGSVEDVKLTTVKLSTDDNTSEAFNNDNVSQLSLYLNGKLLKTVSNGIAEGSTASITFNSLATADNANVIPAGSTYTLEVKANFASSLDAGSFSLKADSGIVSRSAVDGDVINETITNPTVASRVVTTATNGTLAAVIATTDTKADSDSIMLAGNTTASDKYLGELKLTAENEDVKVTEIKLGNAGTYTSSDVALVELVKADGTVVASKIPAANGSVDFNNLSLIASADATTSYFIAVKAKGMNVDGDATSTAVYGHTIQYTLAADSAIKAQGKDSGIDIDAAETASSTKTTTISGAVLNTVTNAMTDGTLVGGTGKTIGKYTLVFENGSNRNASNEELKAVLKQLVLGVSLNGASLTNVKVYVGDDSSKTAASSITTTPMTASGNVTFADLSTLADSAKVDGSVTLTVTADVATTGNNDYVQTSITNANTDIDYIGDGTTSGTALTDNALSVTQVTGATLSK